MGHRSINFRDEYFFPDDWCGYLWAPYPHSEGKIYKKLQDITFRISAEELPEGTIRKYEMDPRIVRMPPGIMKQYKEMERQYVMDYADIKGEGGSVWASSAAVAYSKLKQVASGFIYDRERKEEDQTIPMHEKKYDELESLISELSGQQLIIVYEYRSQQEELLNQYEKMGIAFLAGTTRDKWNRSQSDIISQFNEGRIQLLGLHPKSAGHGLNLHKGGCHHICFLTTPESAGLWEQTIGRIARTGQKHEVKIHQIITEGTVDEDRQIVLESKRSILRSTLFGIEKRRRT